MKVLRLLIHLCIGCLLGPIISIFFYISFYAINIIYYKNNHFLNKKSILYNLLGILAGIINYHDNILLVLTYSHTNLTIAKINFIIIIIISLYIISFKKIKNTINPTVKLECNNDSKDLFLLNFLITYAFGFVPWLLIVLLTKAVNVIDYNFPNFKLKNSSLKYTILGIIAGTVMNVITFIKIKIDSIPMMTFFAISELILVICIILYTINHYYKNKNNM